MQRLDKLNDTNANGVLWRIFLRCCGAFDLTAGMCCGGDASHGATDMALRIGSARGFLTMHKSEIDKRARSQNSCTQKAIVIGEFEPWKLVV